MVKSDGRTFTFVSSKAERCYLLRRNPRKVSWTELYRRKHRKGHEQEIVKKKSRHVRKIDKGISGKSLTDILAIRKCNPEIRKAQKEDAIKIAKQSKKIAKGKIGVKLLVKTQQSKISVKDQPKNKISRSANYR